MDYAGLTTVIENCENERQIRSDTWKIFMLNIICESFAAAPQLFHPPRDTHFNFSCCDNKLYQLLTSAIFKRRSKALKFHFSWRGRLFKWYVRIPPHLIIFSAYYAIFW